MNIAKAFPGDRKPDLLVVELSAILHDILDKKYLPPDLHDSEINTLEYLLPFFETISSRVDLIGSGRAETIAKIIDGVSWTNEQSMRITGEWDTWHDECIELHCVQDADRLDAIGAIGISFLPPSSSLKPYKYFSHRHNEMLRVQLRNK